jgi:hypothetical protein
MDALKQFVRVPASRELSIRLPENAIANEEAEVTVLFKSQTPSYDEKLKAMEAAIRDDLFVADLRDTMIDFEHADYAEELA